VTEKLLIRPPHLHINAAALPWEKLIFSFHRFESCFLKKSRFWCWDEDEDLEMDRVTTNTRSDH